MIQTTKTQQPEGTKMSACQSDKPARQLSVIYDRDIHTKASHSASKLEIGLAGCCGADELNPFDLLALSLGGCLLTLMGQAAFQRGLDIVGAKACVDYELDDYRVKQISVRLEMPKALTAIDRKNLEKASQSCPVYRALDPALEVNIDYCWPNESAPKVV